LVYQDEKQFLKDVERVYKKLGWCVVVVSETIRNKRGERIGREKEHVKADAFGHRYVEGTAQYLAGLVECHLKVRARFEKPGSLQRMSMGYISRVDQKEAFECGRAAVKFAFSGKSEVMVAIQRISSVPYRVIYSAVKLSSIIHQEKLLPHRFIAPCGHDVTVTFKRWGHAFITV
jgi:6-phosphofructokinase 1